MDFVEAGGNLREYTKSEAYRYLRTGYESIPLREMHFLHNLGGTANTTFVLLQDEGFFVFKKI